MYRCSYTSYGTYYILHEVGGTLIGEDGLVVMAGAVPMCLMPFPLLPSSHCYELSSPLQPPLVQWGSSMFNTSCYNEGIVDQSQHLNHHTQSLVVDLMCIRTWLDTVWFPW